VDPAVHYAQLEVPRSFVVLGRRLKPYSIGHAKTLAALGLEFPETLVELAAAVAICCRPGSCCLEATQSFRARLWAFWLGIQIWFTSGRRNSGPFLILIASLEQWREYRGHYLDEPTLIPPPNSPPGQPMGSPGLAVIEHVLTSECGVARSELADMPLDRALFLHAVAREYAGGGRMVSTGDFSPADIDELQRKADEFHEKFMAEQAAKNGSHL
jgi:hypothetical protein